MITNTYTYRYKRRQVRQHTNSRCEAIGRDRAVPLVRSRRDIATNSRRQPIPLTTMHITSLCTLPKYIHRALPYYWAALLSMSLCTSVRVSLSVSLPPLSLFACKQNNSNVLEEIISTDILWVKDKSMRFWAPSPRCGPRDHSFTPHLPAQHLTTVWLHNKRMETIFWGSNLL